MKVGVVLNPHAGGGFDDSKKAKVTEVLKKLDGDFVTTSRIAKMLGIEAEVIHLEETDTRLDTLNLVRMLDGNVDVIAVFGGDGTVSDAASARPKTPLLCIGIGTTNVSPALCPADFEKLREVEMRGLVVKFKEDERVAFNDVVVGSTILSTVEGKKVQVDARSFMKGEKVIARPRKFRAKVEVGDKVVEGVFGNIFVGMTDMRFLGKGIAGGTSLSAFLGFKGVVACISEGIVVSTYTKDDLRRIEPIVTTTISFDDETVKISAEEVVSCDGNPLGVGEVEVRIEDDVVKVMKPFNGQG
ncbi:MAG: NAD(+)/NADH kinase [Archaeoglobus sp.]|uniref:diacylglycerol kinase family protein n=1 Tax=Archaeoglobus sp. TaxID=1872626 RepID=UPI001D9C8617|nr:diacylglycerol kinase family protein [Archaeoglobus sp.]MBO8179258.1 NAD(+)/NADH kinase [Archaeoglobus sp.]